MFLCITVLFGKVHSYLSVFHSDFKKVPQSSVSITANNRGTSRTLFFLPYSASYKKRFQNTAPHLRSSGWYNLQTSVSPDEEKVLYFARKKKGHEGVKGTVTEDMEPDLCIRLPYFNWPNILWWFSNAKRTPVKQTPALSSDYIDAKIPARKPGRGSSPVVTLPAESLCLLYIHLQFTQIS